MTKIIASLVIVGFITTLPLHPIRKDTRLILDELQKLSGQIKDLNNDISTLANDFSTLRKKIDILEEKVTAVTKNQADVNQGKENLLLSLQFIKEELNELKNSLNKVNDRLVSLPSGSMSLAAAGQDNQEQGASMQSPESIYYTAYSDYIKKNYRYAIEGFLQFIKLYPQNALADNSLYWVGECYYAQKMYQDAVNTFTQLIETYGDGDKIPDATLKKGFALIEMGKQTEGVNVLKELTSKFPLSEEASLAQQKIKEVLE